MIREEVAPACHGQIVGPVNEYRYITSLFKIQLKKILEFGNIPLYFIFIFIYFFFEHPTILFFPTQKVKKNPRIWEYPTVFNFVGKMKTLMKMLHLKTEKKEVSDSFHLIFIANICYWEIKCQPNNRPLDQPTDGH